MATNRTRIKRAVRSDATDEARAIFAEALKLLRVYSGCDRSVACRSSSEIKHCPDCLKYLNLNCELDSLLGLKPWETSPLDAGTETPPDWMRNYSQQCEYWQKSLGAAMRVGVVKIDAAARPRAICPVSLNRAART